MAHEPKVYHVVPNANQTRWVLRRESDAYLREEFSTKEEAVDAAKSRARADELSQINVHKTNGSIEYETSCGQAPVRSSG